MHAPVLRRRIASRAPPLPHLIALLSVLRRAAAERLNLLPDGPPRGRRSVCAR